MIPLLVYDQFTYTDAGILDNIHLKMHTRKEILRLIENSNFTVVNLLSILIQPPTEKEQKIIDTLVSLSTSKDDNEYLTYQYIVKAQKQ